MARFCLNLACAQRQNDNQALVCQACGQDLLICDRYFLAERLSSPKANSEVWSLEDWGYWENPALNIDEQDEFENIDKVIKIVKYNDFESIASLQQEYQLLRELHNRMQNIPVPLVSRHSTQSLVTVQSNHGLVMSRVPGVSLAQWVTEGGHRLDTVTVYQWLENISRIVAQFHQAGICHLDLHPANILLDANHQFFIIDFGSAKHYPGRCLQPGIPGYSAPELHKGKFEPSSDYFALARVFIYLCTGQDPSHLFQSPRGREWRPLASQLSARCTALLTDLMEPIVSKRRRAVAGLQDRLKALQYPGKVRFKQAVDAACFSLVATATVMGIRLTGMMMGAELQLFDLGLRLRPHEPLDSRIVVVIADRPTAPTDERSITDANLSFLLQKLNAYGATTVGLDLYRDFRVDPNHPELVNLLKASNLFGVCNIADPSVPEDEGITPPPEMNVNNVGYADAIHDGNRILRRHLLAVSENRDNPCPVYLDFAFLTALHFLETEHGIRIAEPSKTADLKLGDVTLRQLNSGQSKFWYLDRRVGPYQQTDLRGRQILINYRSRPQVEDAARIIELSDLIANTVDPKLFRNRLVLIGAISSRSNPKDRWGTPYALRIPGIFVQAHKVSQLLSSVLDQRPLLWVLPVWAEGIWLWSWSMALGFGVLLLWHFPKQTMILVISLTIGVCWVCYVLLLQAAWLPLLPTVLSMVLTMGLLRWCDRTFFLQLVLRRLPSLTVL